MRSLPGRCLGQGRATQPHSPEGVKAACGRSEVRLVWVVGWEQCGAGEGAAGSQMTSPARHLSGTSADLHVVFTGSEVQKAYPCGCALSPTRLCLPPGVYKGSHGPGPSRRDAGGDPEPGEGWGAASPNQHQQGHLAPGLALPRRRSQVSFLTARCMPVVWQGTPGARSLWKAAGGGGEAQGPLTHERSERTPALWRELTHSSLPAAQGHSGLADHASEGSASPCLPGHPTRWVLSRVAHMGIADSSRMGQSWDAGWAGGQSWEWAVPWPPH